MTAAARALQRQDVPKEQTWYAERVFASWDTWQAELDTAIAELSELEEFSGGLSEGPSVLADWLERFFAHSCRAARLMLYARMANDVDAGDVTAKGNVGQVMGFIGKFSALTAFAEPEMVELGSTLLGWSEQEPRLTVYKHYFDSLLRQKRHQRSAEVEEVLGMLQDPFSGTFQTARELTTTDLTFADAIDGQGKTHHVGQATVPPVGIQSADRERRRSAWEHYCDGYLSIKNTLASNYVTNVKQQVFNVRVRRYESVLESRLSPYNVPVSVFHNLVDTFKANVSTWHRYWEVKRKVLGVDALHPYDIWAPLVRDEPTLNYDQAVNLICEGMAPLGEEYVSIMRRGCLEDRWVDHAPNAGKMQGARSNPSYDTPPFIITSYDDTLMAMSVLAHELGHSMHSYFSDKTQPTVYNGYGVISSSVAETASNVNQALTRAYLLKAKADDTNFQIALIDEAMFNFHRYFFIMPTLARFELEVYTRAEQGKPLTADSLNGIMGDLFAEGYGAMMSDDRERTTITWAQFVHLYMPFYTFQYSIGISAAHAIAADILEGKPNAAENYLKMLSAGGSMYAMELFELAGVDMYTPDPIEKTFKVLADLVDRLEALAT